MLRLVYVVKGYDGSQTLEWMEMCLGYFTPKPPLPATLPLKFRAKQRRDNANASG